VLASRIAFVAFVGAAFYLAACGGHIASTSPRTPSDSSPGSGNITQGQFVAVFGDTEDDLRTRIAAAQAAGLQPAYLRLTTGSGDHVFNVYAQMLRSSRALVVRGFGHVYVFRLTDVRGIAYEDTRVDVSAIPQIVWSGADQAALGTPGRFVYFQPQKTKLCSDCEVLILDAQPLKAQMAQWNGLIDPWQKSPNYVPWAPSPAPGTRHTDGTNHCISGPGYTECWVYGSGYVPGAGGGGSGGDSLSGGKSTPTPDPPPSFDKSCSGTNAQQRLAETQMYNGYNAAAQDAAKNGGEWEDGGYLYHNSSGTEYDVPFGPVQGQYNSSLNEWTFNVPAPESYAGYVLDGWWHTHPGPSGGDYNWANGNGIENGSHFSVPDQQMSTYYGMPGYVAEWNDQGVYSTDPSVMSSEEQFVWYKFTPTSKTTGTESNAAALSGNNGC
jgi:hypothetical protein